MAETTKYKVLRFQIPTKLFNRFYRSTDMSLQEQAILLIQDFVEAKEMVEELKNGDISRSSETGSTSDIDEFSG